MTIGIDKVGFFTPHLYVDMTQLAEARGEDPNKFIYGIGQDKMAVVPPTQDSVTMAANAAKSVLDEADKTHIDLVIFATESGVDHSKAGATYVHRLLDLKPAARSIEMKQACYAATAGIQMARSHVALHPDSRVLVLATDIARYGLNTGGEATQGAGAVAMTITQNPRMLAIEEPSTYMSDDIMDFWRPTYSDAAFADGKYSNEQYLRFFGQVWQAHKTASGLGLEDYAALCFHLPYTKMGLKALRTVLDEGDEDVQERLFERYQTSTIYNRNVGNIYTGALYLSFLSLLEQTSGLKAGDRIGLFSYGSGAVGEFFSGILQPGFQQQLHTDSHNAMLSSRQALTVPEYEAVFEQTLPTDGSSVELDTAADPASVVLAGVADHKRRYVVKEHQ